MIEPQTREEWLEARRSGIGASDAASVIGKNPWKSNIDLWLEKTGRVIPEDISDSPAVSYGTQAEPLLRELFALDHPEMKVFYDQFGMFRHPNYPWLFATLDGWLETPDGRNGVLEIKTTEIRKNRQWDDWKNRVPDHYYCQILHQLLATGFDFVILKAQIKAHDHNRMFLSTRHYTFERYEVEEDMNYLLEKECDFWKKVEADEEPALILPEI